MLSSLEKLTKCFSKFPGIGPRQAKRFVYFLLAQNPDFLQEFSSSLSDLHKNVLQCISCFCFFQKDPSGGNLCLTCKDPHNDASMLLVVEKDVDLENIQKMHTWNNLYFVLGGSLPVLEKEPSKKIRAKELFYTVQERAKNSGLKEIVLAMNANAEGESTSAYLFKILSPLAEKYSFVISTLGRGLSTGTELEYSDTDTFKNALQNRKVAGIKT